MYKTTIRAVTALAIALPPGVALSQSAYPQVSRSPSVVPIYRPCTQLEKSARIPSEQCGTIPLSDVVKRRHEVADEHSSDD